MRCSWTMPKQMFPWWLLSLGLYWCRTAGDPAAAGGDCGCCWNRKFTPKIFRNCLTDSIFCINLFMVCALIVFESLVKLVFPKVVATFGLQQCHFCNMGGWPGGSWKCYSQCTPKLLCLRGMYVPPPNFWNWCLYICKHLWVSSCWNNNCWGRAVCNTGSVSVTSAEAYVASWMVGVVTG